MPDPGYDPYFPAVFLGDLRAAQTGQQECAAADADGGCLLLFWLIDKIVKWDFTGSVTHPLVRYLWYGFYVGMLFVPTLGAFIINYLGKPEDYSHPKKLNYLLIPPTIMLIAVFTNDLHQKVFVFYTELAVRARESGLVINDKTE